MFETTVLQDVPRVLGGTFQADTSVRIIKYSAIHRYAHE